MRINWIILLLSLLFVGYFAGLADAQPCPEGDLDGDCDVDYDDLEIFVVQWLDPPGSCSDFNCADLDDVNGVNMSDFALLAQNWLEKGHPLVINEIMYHPD